MSKLNEWTTDMPHADVSTIFHFRNMKSYGRTYVKTKIRSFLFPTKLSQLSKCQVISETYNALNSTSSSEILHPKFKKSSKGIITQIKSLKGIADFKHLQEFGNIIYHFLAASILKRDNPMKTSKHILSRTLCPWRKGNAYKQKFI